LRFVLISSQPGKAVPNQKDQNDPQSRSHFIAVARMIFLAQRKTYDLLQDESGCVSPGYYGSGHGHQGLISALTGQSTGPSGSGI